MSIGNDWINDLIDLIEEDEKGPAGDGHYEQDAEYEQVQRKELLALEIYSATCKKCAAKGPIYGPAHQLISTKEQGLAIAFKAGWRLESAALSSPVVCKSCVEKRLLKALGFRYSPKLMTKEEEDILASELRKVYAPENFEPKKPKEADPLAPRRKIEL